MKMIIYDNKVELKLDDNLETFWATQEQIAVLFDIDRSGITKHLGNIFESGELNEKSNVQFLHIPNSDKPVKFYNLDAILSVGYRVNSSKATQFRIWATRILKEYIIKGFSVDKERLKDPSRNQYFDELLETIREIRASEKLFYQKVKDIYSTAIDYDKKSDKAQLFFKIVQNKMLFAVCDKTAAELIVARIDENDDNLGLTHFKGKKVRKVDIDIAKNYLNFDENKRLNRLTTMLLDYAEDQAERKKALKMEDWENKLDEFIKFNDYDVLPDAGTVSHDKMEKIAGERYEKFDGKRKLAEKEKAEKEAMKDMEEVEKEVVNLRKKHGKK